jgi:hypothetical protein
MPQAPIAVLKSAKLRAVMICAVLTPLFTSVVIHYNISAAIAARFREKSRGALDA